MDDFMSLDLDNFRGETPTDNEKTEQINRAYRLIAKRCALYDPRIPFTLAADTYRYALHGTDYATYFTKRVVVPYYVTIEGYPLYNARQDDYGFWTMQELFSAYPTWQSDASATPRIAVNLGSSILVYPKPSSASAALATHYIAGTYIPVDLSTDGSIPDLPEEIHECLAFAAAEYAAKPVAVESEMWKRIAEFRGEWSDIVEDIRQTNLNAINAPSTFQTETYPDVLFC